MSILMIGVRCVCSLVAVKNTHFCLFVRTYCPVCIICSIIITIFASEHVVFMEGPTNGIDDGRAVGKQRGLGRAKSPASISRR